MTTIDEPTLAIASMAPNVNLKRSMRTFGTLLLTLSATTPASSVFIIVPGILATAGSGAFLAMVLAAVIGLFMAYVYAEVSSAYPLAGGEYAIVGRLAGPLSGFIVLGIIGVGNLLSLAVMALGLSTYLAVLGPGLPVVPTAIAALVVATGIAILNIRANAILTGLFLLIEILALLVLLVLGVLDVSRPIGDLVQHPVRLMAGHLVATPGAAIGMASSVAIYAYNGFGSAVYFGEETHEPERHVARAVMWALAIAVATELIPLTAVLIGAPDLKKFLGAQNVFGDFIVARGGSALNAAISLGIALAIFNAIIAILLMDARMLFSTGRDRLWPRAVNQAFASIHPRFHSPWVATVVCGVFGIAACFVDLTVLLVVTGTGLVVVYAALCLAAMIGRRRGTLGRSPPGAGHYRMPWYPLAPLAALVMMVYVVYANWLDPAVGRPSLIVTAVIAAVSALYYLVVLRRRGDWAFRGPEET